MGQASRLRLALGARSRAVRDSLEAEEAEFGEDGDADDLRGGGGGGADVLRDFGGDEGGATRAGVDEKTCLSGWMMRPARREHSRQFVAMAATSVREGVMKRRSSPYVSRVAVAC